MGTRALCFCVLAASCVGCGLAVAPDDASIDAAHAIDASEPRDAVVLPRDDAGHDAGHDAMVVGCTATCGTAEDCMAACGDVPGGGIRCCDDSTMRCYVSHTAVCPGGSADAGYDTLPQALGDACPMPSPGTTELTVRAPGLPNVSVTITYYYVSYSQTFVLDDTGTATVSVPMLAFAHYLAPPGLTDGYGSPLVFHLARGTMSVDLTPHCFTPSRHDPQPLDTVEVLLQRDVTTGSCVGIVPTVSFDCTAYHGDYSPAQLDDLPCGPFS